MLVAAGEVGQPPSNEAQAYEISVRAIGRLTEPSEFDNIVLKSGTDGTLVRLKDVGHAELGAESYDSLLRFNGHDAVGIGGDAAPGRECAGRGQGGQGGVGAACRRIFRPG